MKMSVIIATYGRPAALAAAVESLRRQGRPPDEIIVVAWCDDDASRPVIERIVQSPGERDAWPRVTSIMVEENTVSAKENAGMHAASGDIVCFMDDDAVARPDWLDRLEQHYIDPAVAAAGGRDVVIKQGERSPVRTVSRVGRLTWFGRLEGNHHERAVGVRDVDFLKGCNMSFRRGFLSPIDQLLLGSVPYGFEIDLGLALRERGSRLVYDPEALVDHYASSDMSARQVALARITNHNQTYVLLKHLRWPRKLAFLLYTFVIGDRNTIGIVRVPALVWRDGWTRRELWAHFAGKFAGIQTYTRSRRRCTA